MDLKVNQACVFYNYALGFDISEIDLLQTGKSIVSSGLALSVFFSDYKYIYFNENKKIDIGLLGIKINSQNKEWDINFGKNVPDDVLDDLSNSLNLAFHEEQIQSQNLNYLRCNFPPLILEGEGYYYPLSSSVKIYSNGLAILSFQLDATWDGLEEPDFLSGVVNLINRNFSFIWLDSKLQIIDAEIVMKNAFEDMFSIAGVSFKSKTVKRLIEKMKLDSSKVIDDSLNGGGREFNIGGKRWLLYKIFGTENQESEQSNLELCRSIYCSFISSVVVQRNKKNQHNPIDFIWQGRPSVSLLRFDDQPSTKGCLYNNFSNSLSRILIRLYKLDNIPKLPPDLRMSDESCLHANRSVILRTWLRRDGEEDNIWNDRQAISNIYENQARSEQLEYYNMLIYRACDWVHNPLNDKNLMHAYKTLSKFDRSVHISSYSGEIVSAIIHFIKSSGSYDLIASSKESAKFYLDEIKYKADIRKGKNDQMLTFVFGLIGATGLSDFLVKPFIEEMFPCLKDLFVPLVSFSMVGTIIFLVYLIIRLVKSR